jgi:hypothetical protein
MHVQRQARARDGCGDAPPLVEILARRGAVRANIGSCSGP